MIAEFKRDFNSNTRYKYIGKRKKRPSSVTDKNKKYAVLIQKYEQRFLCKTKNKHSQVFGLYSQKGIENIIPGVEYKKNKY
jgi:hypothetical protein